MADDYDVLLIMIDSLRRDFLGTYRDHPRVLDRLDRENAWDDTVVVTTDYGSMLGEHGYIMNNSTCRSTTRSRMSRS